MSDERLVMALLEEGNPATDLSDDLSEIDAATYLATLEQRNSEVTQLENEERSKESQRRSTTPWLVAAIAVIVLGVAALVVSQTTERGIPLAGADGDPQAVEAFREVEAAYELFNTGDPAWMEVRHRGSAGAFEEPSPEDLAAWEAEHAANAHLEVSECTSFGYGDWPGIVDSGVGIPTGYYFICDVTETNSLWNIAGIQLSGTYKWVVDNETVIAVSSQDDPVEVVGFNDAFQMWLEGAHPEVDTETGILNDPETVSTVLEYAEEFVAQSPDYPIETSGS